MCISTSFKPLSAVAAILMLAGCTIGRLSEVAPNPVSATQPLVLQKGSHWATFLFPHSCCYAGFVVGPDKNFWLPDGGYDLWQMTMTGKAEKFPFRAPSYSDNNLSVGADDKFYFGTCATPPSVGVGTRTSNSISITLISIPSGDEACNGGQVLGPDGNVWFVEYQHIGKITTSGIIQEYSYPFRGNYQPGGITTGSDGNLWFTMFDGSNTQVGKIIPATGAISLFPISCQAYGITSAADGNLWAACSFAIVRITTSGVATSFPTNGLSLTMSPSYDGIARGPDGDPWFAGTTYDGCAALSEIDTTTQHITIHKAPLACKSGVDGGLSVATGPDGNIWMTAIDASSNFYATVYILRRLRVTPKSLTFTTTGQSQSINAAESGNPTLTASSSKPAVATVTPGQTNTFVVTSVGVGECKIIVADSIGNSFNVNVSVH